MNTSVTRHYTADSINVVVNHPSVYDNVRGTATGYIDLSGVVGNEDNVLLMGEHGGVLFFKLSPGVYEAHTQVLPAGRGAWTVAMVKNALFYMFTRTDAVDILTKIPKGNLAARALVKSIKGKFEFRAERGWIKDGHVVPADVFTMQMQSWAQNDEQLEAIGHGFHEQLEAEYKRLGKEEPVHEEDLVHDRYVGMAVALIRGGQARKAVVFYNRWAILAGYMPIRITADDPLVISIQEALISVKDGRMFVLRVR